MTRRSFSAALVLAVGLSLPPHSNAQLSGVKNGEWRYLGGDAGHTRSNPHLTQIHAENFSELEVAWTWRSSNFWAGVEYTSRSTPVFVDGVLYTVSGQRRQVVAIDAATGETLWTFREPETMRYLRSPRTDFGKGVAYADVDGRGVVYVTSPAFFLWALDARTSEVRPNSMMTACLCYTPETNKQETFLPVSKFLSLASTA
jgi:quinoprotein glucose dehydrogenase